MNDIFRRVAFAAVFVVLGAYGYIRLTGPRGLPALEEKRQLVRRLEEENTSLARGNEAKRERIRKLRENASEQDLEVRKRTKKVHENETEFILPNTSKAAAPAPDPAPDTTRE